MTDFIVINELQVKRQDEESLMTWHEASTSLTDGWRLPTKEELDLLYQHKDVVGGFANYGYWSSTEYSSTDAWYQFFTNGNQYYYFNNKYYTLPVRAVRAIEMGYK